MDRSKKMCPSIVHIVESCFLVHDCETDWLQTAQYFSFRNSHMVTSADMLDSRDDD